MKWEVDIRHFKADGTHEDETILVHTFALREWRGKNTTLCKTLDIRPAYNR